MLDIKIIRENPQKVNELLKRRNPALSIDEVLEIDVERRKVQTEADELRAKRKNESQKIGMMKKNGENTDAIQEDVRRLGDEIKALEEKELELNEKQKNLLLSIPNMPDENIAIGADDSANIVKKVVGDVVKPAFEQKPHWDLTVEKDLVDFERGVKISQSRFYIYKGKGARLERAIINFFLDVHTSKHGYEEIIYSKPVVEGDFVLVYSLNNSLKIHNEAYKLAKTTHSKLVILKTKPCPPNISVYNDCIEIYTAASEEFLWLISHAKCVITNSYHAMLFSINYGTDFYLYLDNADEENSRMLSTANLCGLKDRVYWMTDSLPNEIIEIDYTQTNEILLEEREKSINLLKESLISSNLI